MISWAKHHWKTRTCAIKNRTGAMIVPCECHWFKRWTYLLKEIGTESPLLDYVEPRVIDWKMGRWYFFIDYRGSGLRKHMPSTYSFDVEFVSSRPPLPKTLRIQVGIHKYKTYIVLGKHPA